MWLYHKLVKTCTNWIGKTCSNLILEYTVQFQYKPVVRRVSARRGCLCVPLRVTRSNMMIILSSIGVLILLPSCGSCTAVAAAGIGCQGTICCWACSCCIKPRGQLTLEDGLPHVRAPMLVLKPPMLPTPNLLDLRRLGMPALKPPEACSPMLHPMLPMPEGAGHAGVDTACSLPSLARSAHFMSHQQDRHVCHHSTQSLHSRFLTREHYLWAWDSTFDSVTFLLPEGGHANVGGSI